MFDAIHPSCPFSGSSLVLIVQEIFVSFLEVDKKIEKILDVKLIKKIMLWWWIFSFSFLQLMS